jgi:hypothetical protein
MSGSVECNPVLAQLGRIVVQVGSVAGVSWARKQEEIIVPHFWKLLLLRSCALLLQRDLSYGRMFLTVPELTESPCNSVEP